MEIKIEERELFHQQLLMNLEIPTVILMMILMIRKGRRRRREHKHHLNLIPIVMPIMEDGD